MSLQQYFKENKNVENKNIKDIPFIVGKRGDKWNIY